MNTLDISPNFTIEDIHKIREHNYEMTKDMNTEEKTNYYQEKIKQSKLQLMPFLKELQNNILDDIETIEADEETDALMEKIRNRQGGYGEYV